MFKIIFFIREYIFFSFSGGIRSHAIVHTLRYTNDRVFAEQCARFDIHYRDG